jgi:hypothetical protein
MNVEYEFHNTDPFRTNEFGYGAKHHTQAFANVDPMAVCKHKVREAATIALEQGDIGPGTYVVVQRVEDGVKWIDGWSWVVEIEAPSPTIAVT